MSVTSAIRDLNELVPHVRVRAEDWITQCRPAGLDVRVSETYRSPERQAYLYSKGLTTVKTHGAHYYRVALDFFFVEGGKTAYPATKMQAAAAIAKRIGFTWGGDWKIRDTPHLEMLGGVTLAQYRIGVRPSWYSWKPEMETEEEKLSYDDFKQYMDRYLCERAEEAPSSWASEVWARISNKPSHGDPGRSVMDGSNPRGFITREEAAAVLGRLGLLE